MRTHARVSLAMIPAALLALVGAVGGCSSSTDRRVHWSYEGEHGPAFWGELTPEWRMAHEGRAQSPINLSRDHAVEAGLPALKFIGAPTMVRAIDNGHTIEWECHTTGGANTLTIGREVYALRGFHFHAPSEHTVEGRHYPVELHFVHANAQGNLAVVAVMLGETSRASEVYAALERTMPREARVGEPARFDPYALLPHSRTYATYSGSLTTPPCTEGVRWIVMTTPSRIAPAQIASFTETYSGNARPVQPANGRLVFVRD